MKTSVFSLPLLAIMATMLVFSCSKSTKDSPAPILPDKGDTISLSGAVSGIWRKGSLYRITGHVEVPKGQSLTIQEGVTVMMMNPDIKPEFIVQGNLYCYGTATNPIKFTVPENLKAANTWGRLWGGIIAGTESSEILLEYTELEYGGAVTTEESPSVKAGLYKAEAGEAVPAVWFGNPNGKLVIMHCKIHNFGEDGIYVDGGKLIVAYNTFYTTGETGADAINIKSGTLIDAAFNLIYSPNTNALKTSNSGDRTPQAHVIAYNNTIVNAGWRRPTIKGGSIWLEKGVHTDLYNNLLVNNRFGIKRDAGNPEDNRSEIFSTFYYGHNQQCVDQFQPSKDIIGGIGDIRGTKAGENDPKFENYPLDTDMNNYTFSASWDFHLKPGSPALTGGKTDFTRHFGTEGLIINGKTYISPAPAIYIGAFGLKTK